MDGILVLTELGELAVTCIHKSASQSPAADSMDADMSAQGVTFDSPKKISTPNITSNSLTASVESRGEDAMRTEMVLRTPHGMHQRPADLIKQVCDLFPQTKFRILRTEPKAEPKEVDPKGFVALLSSQIAAGELVELEVTGPNEALATAFVKTAWEAIRIEDPPVSAATSSISEPDQPHVREVVYQALLEVSEDIEDPDKEAILAAARLHLMPRGVETRKVTVLKKEFTGITGALLPMIARRYGCQINLMYEIGERGIYSCEILPDEMGSFLTLLVNSPPPGSKVTLRATGDKSPLAAKILAVLLENLDECETWLRNHSAENDDAIVDWMVRFAKGLPSGGGVPPHAVKIRRSAFLNVQALDFSDVVIDKELALRTLCDLLQGPAGVDTDILLKGVQDREKSMSTYLDQGLAVPHAVDLDIQKHTIALGIYPAGIPWDGDNNRAYFVFMSAVAKNAQREYLAYLARLARLFLKHIGLRKDLFGARTPEAANRILRAAERALNIEE